VSAYGAFHVGGEVPTDDIKGIAFDDGGVAVGAVRVFGWVPGHVAHLNVI